MTLKLFDYDQFFHVDTSVLHATLETGRTVSLHDTVGGSIGRCHVGLQGVEPVTTYYSEIHANAVVVGDGPWNAEDQIRRARFSIPHTKPLVRHSTKVRQPARRSLSMQSSDTQVFDIHSHDVRVRCWYGGTGSWELGLNRWWPIFEMEFDEPRRLDTYLNDVHRLLRIFSAAAGFQLTPSDISISSLTHQQHLSNVGQARSTEDHQVEYMWPEATIGKHDLHVLHSFVAAFDARERRALSACLETWLDRSEEWEEASTLMMGSLGLHGEISGDRLLMACRWLEKIPTAGALQTVCDSDIDGIVASAASKARRLGHGALHDRIAGALRWVKFETHRSRFTRLTQQLNKRFPDAGFDHVTISDLMLAQQLRGTVAHGLYDPDATAPVPLQRAITAVEALCYLLMIQDLPVSPQGRRRAVSGRVVRDHRLARAAG